MGFFDREAAAIQARSDRAREKQREELWRSQCLHRFKDAGLTALQINAAKQTFFSGFDVGWESHQAFLMSEYAKDSQTKKVNLA